jgi:cation diffusion facilitator CzcD-associated flavoprotein CzcO
LKGTGRTAEPDLEARVDGSTTETETLVIGSGFGGLGMAIRLRQEGFEDIVVLERAHDVGGTWRDNTYPGAACDVQSHLYSFSFAPNPEWSHSFSRQPEIQAYLQRCARDFGVLPLVRFGHEVTGAEWDDAAQRWTVRTSRGDFRARALVMAAGALSDPLIPGIPGLDTFRGAAFHSARWDHAFDPRGKRVAVIGTGASAIQFVPALQPEVARMHVFQRTPPWILPRPGGDVGPRARGFFRRVPAAQRALRGAIYLWREGMVFLFRSPATMRLAQRRAERYLRRAVRDPELRRKLTPDFTLGCKRVLLSNDYLPALTQPNVEVVTDRIARISERGVVTADGAERAVDAIVFGTGFRPTDPPLGRVTRGRGGRTLAAAWAGSPQAHLGTTVAGFPNLFILMGPNTGLGHTSVVYMIEAQIEHALRVLKHARTHGVGAVEPRAEAQARFVAGVDRRMRGTVWTSGGCASWYLDETGRNSTLWPDFTWRFRRLAERFDPGEYEMTPVKG